MEAGAKHRWNHEDVVFTLRNEGEGREDFDQPLNLKILLLGIEDNAMTKAALTECLDRARISCISYGVEDVQYHGNSNICSLVRASPQGQDEGIASSRTKRTPG